MGVEQRLQLGKHPSPRPSPVLGFAAFLKQTKNAHPPSRFQRSLLGFFPFIIYG